MKVLTIRIFAITLLFFGLITASHAQFWKKKKNRKIKTELVKVFNYEREFEIIDSLIELDQSKTALSRVLAVKQRAKAEHSASYQIKALDYQLNLVEKLGESDEIYAEEWQILMEEMRTADNELKVFLSMDMAQFLRNRFSSFAYNQERISDDSSMNPENWNVKKLHVEINFYITQSIELAAALKLDKKYEPLILNIEHADFPLTMPQIMALKAISILNGLNVPTTSTYKSPKIEDAMADVTSFLTRNFKMNDDPKNEYRILELYQLILANYHIYFDMERLKYAKNAYIESEAMFIAACEHIIGQYASNPYSNLAVIELVIVYQEKNPAKALALIEEALKRHPDFEKNVQLRSIKNDILRAELQMEVEKVNQAGKKMLAKVSYTNISKLFVKVYKIDYLAYMNKDKNFYDEESKEKFMEWLDSQKNAIVSNYAVSLPNFHDYKNHSSEIALDSLSLGTYLILCSNAEDMQDSSAVVSYASISVSRYVIVEDKKLYLFHGASGQKAASVPYKVLSSQHGGDRGKYDMVKSASTNADGLIEIPESSEYYQPYLVIVGNQELIYNGDAYHYPQAQETDRLTGHMLCDRSIYRPGQTLFFKGILFMEKSKNVAIGKQVKVMLRNTNGEEKGALVLSTNKYGSVNGSFVLPKGGFNTGDFHLDITADKEAVVSHYFKVEEYKRPKYTASILVPEKAYKLNDRVHLIGEAKALAGYAVQGARVSYSVKRRLKPRYRFYKYLWDRNGNELNMANGDTITNQDGRFYISFDALPDETVDKTSNPYFIYEINASITDINGEIRTCSYSMTMAYTDLQLSISGLPEYIVGQQIILDFSAINLQDKNLAFTGNILLKKVIKNPLIKRERLWVDADTSSMSDMDFNLWFPQYHSGKSKENTTDMTRVEFVDDQKGQWMIKSGVINEPGEYIAIISSKDGRGETIQSECRFEVSPAKPGPYILPNPLKLTVSNGASFEPGKTAKVLIASGAENVLVSLKVQSKRGVIMEKTMSLGKIAQTIDIPVMEADRGNISVFAYLVSDYRLYQEQCNIVVPYSNKQLQLKVTSFRNDMEPGSKEKWTVSLKGPAAEKAAIETVAAMYDQSLDELYEGPYWNTQLYSDFTEFNEINSSITIEDFATLKTYESEGFSYSTFLFPEYNNENFMPGLKYYHLILRGSGQGYGSVSGPGTGTYTLDYGSERLYAFSSNIGYKDEDQMLKKTELGNVSIPQAPRQESAGPVIRKNFNETAFFFPNLYANAKGEITLEFSMPEALTKWKMMMLSHSTTMQLGYLEQSVTTSKKIMVQPNMPRFLRQGDKISIASKIVNTTNAAITAKVSIRITDEETGNTLAWLNGANDRMIIVPAGGHVPCSFNLDIPDYTGIVNVAIYATTGNYSDGEQNTLLVLSKRSLITETMPITIRKAGVQNLEFQQLKNNSSASLTNEKLSVEMSANPTWYAVQSLPYMMEFPHECAEQVFTRLYANSIAVSIANNDPAIRKVYEAWEREAANGTGLQSKLMMNQDLKTTLLEETPWLNDAKNETERMKLLGKLFNRSHMQDEIDMAYGKLKDMQMYNGAWAWFKGMEPNVYITQTIVIGFGKMKKMGVDISAYQEMIQKAIVFLDEKAKIDYLHYQSMNGLQNFYPVNLQYLYCKSYFPDTKWSDTSRVMQYFIKNAEQTWQQNSLLNRAQLAMALYVLKPSSEVPKLIIASFNENAKQTDEMGMYWPKNTGGWYWYEAPVETQAAIIDAYSLIDQNKNTIREQQIWLLRQKQTQGWKTTRGTADACYALLMQNNLLQNKQDITVTVNNTKIVPDKKEEGTGYFRQNVNKTDISAKSGDISVSASTSDFAYGAVYWQYFEDMDKIQSAGSGLNITKRLYKMIHSSSGDQKIEIKEGDVLHVGDIIEISLSISSDRNLEFVHIKDLRASGTEPSDVLSSYHWQNGLGYYQSTRDASTNFFVDYMPKGNFQLNYTLKVEQAGVFNSGMATAQCMYAPEYAAHSKGLMMKVE